MTPSTVLCAQAIAITLVFVQGGLFEPLRKHGPKLWRDLVSCALCSGVWIGAGWTMLDASIWHGWGGFSWSVIGPESLGNGAITGVFALTVKWGWDLLEAALDRAELPQRRPVTPARFPSEPDTLKQRKTGWDRQQTTEIDVSSLPEKKDE